MTVSTLAAMRTFMLAQVPAEKARTYTTKCFSRCHRAVSSVTQPHAQPPHTKAAVATNWASVTKAGAPTWCTASLLSTSMPPEHAQ